MGMPPVNSDSYICRDGKRKWFFAVSEISDTFTGLDLFFSCHRPRTACYVGRNTFVNTVYEALLILLF